MIKMLPGRLLLLLGTVVLLLLLSVAPATAGARADMNHSLGLNWSDDIKNHLASHKPKVKRDIFNEAQLPGSQDWSFNMPPVGDQGSQGSCVGWSMGYALRSYLYQVKTDWGVKTADHQFSPAYIYNQINGGIDQGSSPYDAARLLEDQGCDTLAGMPYNYRDYTTQPTSVQKARAANYKIADWDYIGNETVTIKNALASGPVWAGTAVYWTSGWQISGDVCLAQISPGMLSAGGHGICLVGYDDEHVTADGRGAFKFINSWGSTWGHSGYGWISYQYLQKYGTGAMVLYEMASPISLSISGPTSAASYSIGQKLPISWSASGIDKVDIYLISLKPAVTVATSVTASTGSYSWSIPENITPGSYKIQINAQGSNIMAVSPWFEIRAAVPAISVTAPAAGTSFPVGQKLPISWSASGIDKVDIYLISLKPGVTVATSVTASAGSYSWSIPENITPGSYKIQINAQGSNIMAVSPWFEIKAAVPAISVTAPAAGTSFPVGQKLPISWSASGIDKVDIYLISLKPGLTVATSVTASAGSYSWSIPENITPGSYKIQINAQGSNIMAVSPWFEIKAAVPAISVTAPAAGTSFPVGQKLPISWSASGIDKVDIYLISLKPGVTVATSVTASTGSYSWSIPENITPGSYKIQINAQGSNIMAVSPWFEIKK